jgi:hypothetical protein
VRHLGRELPFTSLGEGEEEEEGMVTAVSSKQSGGRGGMRVEIQDTTSSLSGNKLRALNWRIGRSTQFWLS